MRSKMKAIILPALLVAALGTLGLSAGVLAQSAQQTVPAGTDIAGLRPAVPLDENARAPRLAEEENDDIRRPRNYPEQPPTIPHKTDGYQVDKNGNQCLSCHSRTRVAESGAPMISITHFMDRDGQALAAVSPRRYFCNQCHVTQVREPPMIGNTFVDIDSLLAVDRANQE